MGQGAGHGCNHEDGSYANGQESSPFLVVFSCYQQAQEQADADRQQQAGQEGDGHVDQRGFELFGATGVRSWVGGLDCHPASAAGVGIAGEVFLFVAAAAAAILAAAVLAVPESEVGAGDAPGVGQGSYESHGRYVEAADREVLKPASLGSMPNSRKLK